ncbi:MAG: FlgD immunoglobulin-like domain containing protein [Candidatus Latescibacterota bacterium]
MRPLPALLLATSAAALVPAAAGAFQCAGVPPPDASEPRARPATIRGPRTLEPRGTVRALVLFARFADEADHPVPAFAASLFDPDTPGSLTHFFTTMSFAQLRLDGSVLPGRRVAPESRPVYTSRQPNGDGAYGRFVWDLLAGADATVDFRAYDNDGPDGHPDSGDDDGAVDYLFIVVQSAPFGFIRGAATGVAGLGFQEFVTHDRGASGRPIEIWGRLARGSLVAEGTFVQTAGAMAHEFAHAFGLPDLYDTDYDTPEHDSAGIGRWGLMGWGAHGWTPEGGPIGLCPYSLERLGWIGVDNDRLVEVDRPQGWELEDLHAGGHVLKVHLPAQVRASGQQTYAEPGYLLLEHRRRSACPYNRDLPAEGLLVWHVRPGRVTNANETLKVVDMVCADAVSTGPGRSGDDLDRWAHDPTYARAHGGDLGDAGDPFDGVSRTALYAPAPPDANALGDYVCPAVSPLSLRIARRLTEVRVAVRPPSWSGALAGGVHWAGVVLVTGEVTVPPGDTLYLHRGLEVRVGNTSAAPLGPEPLPAALHVQGGLLVVPRYDRLPVRFRALDPGQAWGGIGVGLSSAAPLDVPQGALEIHDAGPGVHVLGAPPGIQGLVVGHVGLEDLSDGLCAGNGDGRLQPGESAELTVRIDNWSLTTYEDALLRPRWDGRLLQPAWPGWQGGLAHRLDVPPGPGPPLSLAILTVDPRALAGQTVRIGAELHAGPTGAERDTLLPLAPLPAALPAVELETPADQAVVGGRLVLAADEALRLTVRVRPGRATASQAVAFDTEGDTLAARVSLARQADGSFAGALRLDGVAEAIVRPWVRLGSGAVTFGEPSVQVSVPFAHLEPALLAMAAGTTPTPLAEMLTDLGRPVSPVAGSQLLRVGSALLARYAVPPRLVIWPGGLPNAATRLLSAYLERGGSLLAVGLSFHQGVGATLLSWVGVEDMGGTRTSALYEATTNRQVCRPLPHAAAARLSTQARALLVDAQGQAAAWRLDTGQYRVVYVGLDPARLPAAEGTRLLQESLDGLQAPAGAAAPPAARRSRGGVAPLAWLAGAHPNPCNGSAVLAFTLSEPVPVQLALYDALGQRVRLLVDGPLAAGQHSPAWDGRDERGRPVASGVYFARLRAAGTTATVRLILLR